MDNYVVDAHIHFEHQEYGLDLIDKMVEVALKRGVSELHLLDHTHKFSEFAFLYEDTDEITKKHYSGKSYIPIKDYLDFIEKVKEKSYPVKLKFGLEVCYFYEHEKMLKDELSKYNFDFLIGSVHHIDGFGFDLGKDGWEGKDVDHLWTRYFDIMEKLISSDMFDHLAHADSLKIYGYYPSFDLNPYYEKISDLLLEHNMSTENNSGFARYGYSNYGLDKNILEIFKRKGVMLYKSSDAHKFEDIGNKFDELVI